LKIININQEGYLDLDGILDNDLNKLQASLGKIINENTKIFTLTHISNVLGTINPVKEIVKIAKKINPKIIIIVDAAQSVPHLDVDVQDINCDFIAFSAHKMLGPTGVGILYGKKDLLKEIFPFLFGGEMIKEVTLEKTTFKDSPYKFEAGTPAIGEVIGFGAAVDYLKKIGLSKIREHELSLTDYALRRLKEEFGNKIKIFGPTNSQNRAGVIAFQFDRYHPHDVAQILDEENIAVRAGHHCAMPLHHQLKVEGTVRVSFYIYNTQEDIEKLVKGLKKVFQRLR
jgi:cysteine desulfurase/selenocysteine lyase